MITTCIPSNYTIMYISVDRYPINYAFVHNPQPGRCPEPPTMTNQHSCVNYIPMLFIVETPSETPTKLPFKPNFLQRHHPYLNGSHGRNYTPTCITCLPLKLTIFAQSRGINPGPIIMEKSCYHQQHDRWLTTVNQ